jgi:nucleotide-binding universal stress UspA family protein
MQSILVAVDGSPQSLNGVREGATLAKAISAKLELVNVLPPIFLAPSVYAETIQKLEEGNRQNAEAILQRAQKIAAELGVESEKVMVTGAPAEALADLAQADRVWGVVIGAKGHSAVSRVLLGSVTDRLVHICSKPVLVVR